MTRKTSSRAARRRRNVPGPVAILPAVNSDVVDDGVPDPGALDPDGLSSGAPDPPGRRLPSQTVWYRLHKLTNLLSRPFFTHFAKPFALSHNSWPLVMTLAVMPNSASHELCEVTGLHPMNVSRAVASLRRQGRIREKRDPANRRRKLLTLTPKGWAVYHALMPHLKRMSALLCASMPPGDIETLSKLIDRLISRVEEITATSGDLLLAAAPAGGQAPAAGQAEAADQVQAARKMPAAGKEGVNSAVSLRRVAKTPGARPLKA